MLLIDWMLEPVVTHALRSSNDTDSNNNNYWARVAQQQFIYGHLNSTNDITVSAATLTVAALQ